MAEMIPKEILVLQLGQKIREHRIVRNQTIENLASDAGLDYSQLSRIERGKINTSVYHLYTISCALNIPITDLFRDVL